MTHTFAPAMFGVVFLAATIALAVSAGARAYRHFRETREVATDAE